MSAQNLFNALLMQQDSAAFRPLIDPRAFAAAFQEKLRQTAPQPQSPSPAAPAGAYAPIGAKIDDQRRKMQGMVERLGTVPDGLGKWAPLAGVLSGLAANKVAGREDATLQELYAEYEAQQAKQAEMAAAKERQAKIDAAVAAEAKRGKDMADWQSKEQWKRDNPMPMTPQDQAQMQATQAQIASLMQQMEQRKQDMTIDAAEADREAAEIAEEEENAEVRMEDLRGLVREIYANEGGLESYSGYSGSMPTVRPEQKGYEAKIDRLKSGLTIDNLQNFKGAMSEKEMATAAAAAQSIVEGADIGSNKAELERLYTSFGGDVSDLTGGGDKASRRDMRNLPSVGSQAEYDALPSGSEYIEDGKRYRKP